MLVDEREDDEEERQKQCRATQRPVPRRWLCLPNRPRALAAGAGLAPVRGAPARAIPFGGSLGRRLDLLPRLVDVDVFVLMPPFLRAAAPLLAGRHRS